MNMQRTTLLEGAALEGSYALPTLWWTQLEPGSFEVAYRVADAPPLRIAHRAYNLAFAAGATIESGKTLIATVSGRDTPARWFGNDLDGDTLAVSRTEIDVRTGGPSGFFAITVDEEALQRQYPRVPDAAALLSNIAASGVARNRDGAARLRTGLQAVFSQRATSPSQVASLIPLLADALDRFEAHAVERSKCLNRRFTAVRRCEAYMREHIDSTVTLLHLSEASGMRSRSLINAFEAVTGLSPMDYLKRLRLHGVRRALSRARKAQTRVIDVATAWGFWHMGHFATDYRAMFGESPSRTLLGV